MQPLYVTADTLALLYLKLRKGAAGVREGVFHCGFLPEACGRAGAMSVRPQLRLKASFSLP